MKFNLKRLAVFTLVLGLLFSSCENEEIKETTPQATAVSVEIGELVQIMYRGEMITAEKRGDKYVIEGDLIVTPDDGFENRGGGETRQFRFWPSGVVYYELHSSLSQGERDAVSQAVNNMNPVLSPNVRFELVTLPTSRTAYISIRNGSQAESEIGFQNKIQILNTGGAITVSNSNNYPAEFDKKVGTITHEFCHALGMQHEHNKSDRARFLRIIASQVSNPTASGISVQGNNRDYTNGIDYNSVTIYGTTAVAGDPNNTTAMTKRVGGGIIERKNVLSSGDIETLRLMYAINPRKSDIVGNHFYSEIDFMVATNRVAGYSDGTFRPNNFLKRGEFASMICDVMGLQTSSSDPNPFTDISAHWAKAKILAAVKAGYLSANATTYRPEDLIRNLEVTLAISNKHNTTSNISEGNLNQYHEDVANIPTWARAGIAKATSNGFIANVPNRNKFNPSNYATRGYAVFVLYQGLVKKGTISSSSAIKNPYQIRLPIFYKLSDEL